MRLDLETLAREIDQAVESRRAELLALCGALVDARSENPPGDTTSAARVVRAYLSNCGIDNRVIARSPDKPNVVAEITGAGAGRHLIFNVHLDTVLPGEAIEWRVPIYEVTRRDGRLYGLGLGNMKAGVAAQSLAVSLLADRQNEWRGRISFTAVADEITFGADGAAFLLDSEAGLLGDAVICGEGPGDMTLGIAEKGVCWIALEAQAPSGQGMLTHRGTSATARLASAITELDILNGMIGICPDEIAGAGADAHGHRSRVSVNVGTIAGGRFISQVATRAVAEVDVRIPPGLAVADIENRLRAIAAHYAGMSVRRIKAWEPNWTGLNSPVVQAVAAAHAAIRGSPPVPAVRLPASDASRWRARGIPAVCYGPQPELVAGTNDYVHEQDLLDCAKVYALAALSYLDGAG